MEILHDFGVEPVYLAAQIVNFSLLLFILNKLVYKPVIRLLEERKKKIAESLEMAKKIEERLNTLEEHRQQLINQAKLDSKKIIDESRQIAAEIKSQADKDSTEKIESAVKKAEEATVAKINQMQTELKKDIIDLVVETLETTTGKILTEEDQKKLIEKHVREVGKI